ncbi:hypothetical protein SK128_026673, partial [Halocaridina rubra]
TNAAFNDREGFSIQSPSVKKHAGSYTCEAVYDDETNFRDFDLDIIAREESLAQPNVTVKGYWQKDPTTYLAKNVASYDVVEGSPVYLNCSYKIDGLTHRYLNWEGPSSSVNEWQSLQLSMCGPKQVNFASLSRVAITSTLDVWSQAG